METPLPPDHPVSVIAEQCGGKIDSVGQCPDGSGFATVSFPLPKDHWIYKEGFNVPPMPFRLGTRQSEMRELVSKKIREVAKYAIRASTMNGTEIDFDPDAMVQNFVIGMLGYHTEDGLSCDASANPPTTAPPTPS